jgi:hypothetical protein
VGNPAAPCNGSFTLDAEDERDKHTVFDEAHTHFSFAGVNDEQASRLVDIFTAK